MFVNPEAYRLEGFLSVFSEGPFVLPEINPVDPSGIEEEIHSMIQDATSDRSSALRSLLLPVERWIEGRVLYTLSGRVLGIYTQRIISDHQSRILIVPENVSKVANQWQVQEEDLRTWILSHEGFHAVQLDPRFPLREHMRSSARDVVQGTGDIKQLVAAMSWIEGSADWVMDRPGLLDPETIQTLRNRMSLQRSKGSFSIWMRLLRQKREQYEQGRRFVEAAWKEIGPLSLLLPIQDPLLLPRPDEQPLEWTGRLQK